MELKSTIFPGGSIEVDNGATWADGIFEAMAIVVTQRKQCLPTNYLCDRATLKIVESMLGTSAQCIGDSIGAIGMLLAHADAELPDNVLSNIGLLLKALSTMSSSFSHEAADIRYTLDLQPSGPDPASTAPNRKPRKKSATTVTETRH